MKAQIKKTLAPAAKAIKGLNAKIGPKISSVIPEGGKLKIKKLKKKTVKKAASAAVAAAVIAASVTSAFSSPDEILAPGQFPEPTPIVQTVEFAPDSSTDDAGEAESEDKKTRRVRDMIRERLLRLPLAVRAVFVLPVYCAGWLIMQLLGLAAGTVLPAIGSTVLGWLAMTLVVIAAAALLLKAVFPDVPLKEILRPKHIAWTAAAVAIVYVVCAVLSAYSEDAARWIKIIKFAGCLLTAVLAYCAIERKFRGKSA